MLASLLAVLPWLIAALPAAYALVMRRPRMALLLLVAGVLAVEVPTRLLLRDAEQAAVGADVPGVVALAATPWLFALAYAALGTIVAAFAGARGMREPSA
jgi:hypothetical protein